MKKEKTSLERSHSKLSNFKLTLICIISSIAFVLLFISIALIKINLILGSILTGVSVLLALFGIKLVSKFTR